jgi:hypothetical protein
VNEELKQAIREELGAFAWEDYGLEDALFGRTTDWADNLAELIAQRIDRPVAVDHRVIMAFIQAPDEPDGDIGGPLRTAFRAAGFTVAGDPS